MMQSHNLRHHYYSSNQSESVNEYVSRNGRLIQIFMLVAIYTHIRPT